jgi:hypothetical protein
MSDPETAVSRLLGPMMSDISIPLNGLHQYVIAKWAVKTAMLCEFASRRKRPLFFHKTDYEQLRVASNLPIFTTVFLARHSFSDHIGFWGNDAWSNDRRGQAHINTMLFG